MGADCVIKQASSDAVLPLYLQAAGQLVTSALPLRLQVSAWLHKCHASSLDRSEVGPWQRQGRGVRCLQLRWRLPLQLLRLLLQPHLQGLQQLAQLPQHRRQLLAQLLRWLLWHRCSSCRRPC